ncbi:MAG: DUF7088 domain-containing protein [Planctomycetota bacterium]
MSIVVVLGLVAAIVYAATRPALRVRLDLTEGAHFTLSAQTRSVLAGLKQPVEIVQLLRPESQLIPNGLYEVQQRAIDYVDNLVREYAIASGGQVRVRRLDPFEDRLEAERLARDLHLTRYNVVVVQGARLRQVFLEEMATIDRGLAEPGRVEAAQLVDLRGEAALTSALLSATAADDPRIGFLGAVGAPAFDDTRGFGLGILAEALRGQGLEPELFTLVTEADQVPEGLRVAVLWGPAIPLSPHAAAALLAFHRAGGSLLLGIDPVLEDPALDGLLGALGLQRERAVLCLDEGSWEGERRSLLALNRFDPTHAISAPIGRQGYFATAAGLGGLERLKSVPLASASALVLTSEKVFGDRASRGEARQDFVADEDELRGPRVVAYAVESPNGARAVVFGGSSLLTNPFLTSAEGGRANLDLGLHSANWLVSREDAIAERPKQVFESQVDLLEDERRVVMLYVLGLMPLAAVLLGVLVWFARRH